MTGTEMSLEILQSGYVWSSLPYSNFAKYLIEKISKLSPRREFYPKHLKVMQRVAWPEMLPSMNSHEGFEFITNKLLFDSESEDKIKNDRFLESRAFNNADKYQNNLAKLKANFKILIQKDKHIDMTRGIDYNCDSINNLRTYKNSSSINLYKKSNFNLVNFIFSENVHNLMFNLEEKLEKWISIKNWIEIANSFKENWIVLYKFSIQSSKLFFENNLKLKMILSLVSYLNKDIPLNILLFFNLVSENNEKFKEIKIPNLHEIYIDIQNDTKESILEILDNNFINKYHFNSVFERKFFASLDEDYLDFKKEQLEIAKNIIGDYGKSIDLYEIEILRRSKINFKILFSNHFNFN